MYNEDCNIAPGFKIKYNKQTNNDTLKPIAIYAANGDIFNETSNLLSDVAVIATNNNIENTSFLSPRKRKTNSKSKPKKTKTQANMHDNLSVMQLPSTIGSIQNSETLVTSLPVDINKILPKQEKADGISVSVSDEQYQIYLIET